MPLERLEEGSAAVDRSPARTAPSAAGRRSPRCRRKRACRCRPAHWPARRDRSRKPGLWRRATAPRSRKRDLVREPRHPLAGRTRQRGVRGVVGLDVVVRDVEQVVHADAEIEPLEAEVVRGGEEVESSCAPAEVKVALPAESVPVAAYLSLIQVADGSKLKCSPRLTLARAESLCEGKARTRAGPAWRKCRPRSSVRPCSTNTRGSATRGGPGSATRLRRRANLSAGSSGRSARRWPGSAP